MAKYPLPQVVTRLVPDRVLDEVPKPFPTRSKSRSSHGVSVPGVDNVLVRFARCCNPVPGDEIIGYVTRGRGVSVHRLDCRNASIILDNDEERAVEVCWDTKAGESYPVDIEMEAYDAPGLLTLVINTTVEMKAHVSAVTARTVSNRLAVINMTMEINDVKHMNSVIERLKRISGVQSVRRAVLS